MTLGDVGAVVGLTIGVGGVIVAGGRWVLANFHATEVRPMITDVAHAIGENTRATAGLTAALARTDETQREGQAQNRQAFDRMGKILQDHETRLTAVEEHVPTLRARRGESDR